MEVLFAIGIILVGLLGVIAILPVAGKQAMDSVALNRSGTISSQGSSKLLAADALNPRVWRMQNDNSITFVFPAADLRRRGVCIDPMFVLSTQSRTTEQNGGYFTPSNAPGANSYQRNRFPYYRDNHNPLIDPSLPFNASTAWPAAHNNKLARVFWIVNQSVPSEEVAARFQTTFDDLSVDLPKDRTLPPSLVRAGLTSFPAGQTVSTGRYTWFATISPLASGTSVSTRLARVWLAVVDSRDVSFATRRNSEGVAATARGNATAERVALVVDADGFAGGGGGTVQIAASINTVSRLRENDWVMLSNSMTHGWYRVIAVLDDAEETSMQDPVVGGTREVWTRTLMLDGPDWSFNSNDATDPPTLMTLVEGVVSVQLQTVRLSL